MNLHEEDLNLLLVFDAIMQTRSVSKASERLNVSQPSMSNALARLRKAFDDPMFIRVKNTMEPTPHALSIAAAVSDVLARARDEIFRRRTFTPETSTQTFTLCMTDLAEAAYMPEVINAFRAEAPHAKLRTVSPLAERLEEGLESGAVDLAIGYFPDITDAGVLQQRLLRSTGFCCIISEDNPHLENGKVTLGCFCNAPHVATRTEGRSHEVIDLQLTALDIRRNVALTLPHFLGLLSIIPRTELMGIIPNDLIATFESQARIRVHPLPFQSPAVKVTQVWHRRYDQDAANRWLRTLVKNALRHRDAGDDADERESGLRIQRIA